MIRCAATVLVALLTACTGTLELELPPDLGGGSEPDSDTGGEPSTPDPDPDPGDTATPLTLVEVQSAFDAGLLAALSGAAPGATVTDTRASARVDGTAGEVRFTQLVVTKAPFAIAGSATVTARGEVAEVSFAGGSPSGQVTAGGAQLGSIEAGFPALDDFAEDSTIELLGLVIACDGVSVGEAGGVLSFDGSCSVTDDAGQVLGTATVSGVEIDLVTGEATGSIVVDAGGVVAELRFNGGSVDLIVDGEAVGTVDLSALVAALL